MASTSKSTFIGGLVVIILIFNFIFVIKPLRADINTAKADTSKIDTEIKQLQSEINKLGDVNKDLPTDEVTRSKLLVLAPEELNQSELINALTDIASKNSISLNAINFDEQGEDSEIPGLNKVSISANLTGTYDNLISFLQGIEASKRAMVVRSINVQKTDNSEKSAVMFNLYLEAYYQ